MYYILKKKLRTFTIRFCAALYSVGFFTLVYETRLYLWLNIENRQIRDHGTESEEFLT